MASNPRVAQLCKSVSSLWSNAVGTRKISTTPMKNISCISLPVPTANFQVGSAKRMQVASITTSRHVGLISRNYHILTGKSGAPDHLCSMLSRLSVSPVCKTEQTSTSPFMSVTRTVTKCSWRKGRRKTVNCIKNRFYRLDWGGWISPLPGRARHLWKESAQRRNQLRHHVLRTAEESKLLDKMCTKYWIKKKHFVDDPYESYHVRDHFPITKGLQGIDSTLLYQKRKKTIRPDKNLFKLRP